MNTLIQRWLTGNRNFFVGRLLYNQFGKDEVLKVVLAKGESPSTKAKLLEALRALLKPVEKPAEPKEIEAMPAGDDEVEKSIQKDWKAHYTNMNLLRGKLDVYGADNSPQAIAACGEICRQILEEEQYINACWEKLDYYKEHGRLPDEREEVFIIPEDPIAIGKLIESIKRNIRRNKQKAAQEPANAAYPALINKYEQQLKLINDQKN